MAMPYQRQPVQGEVEGSQQPQQRQQRQHQEGSIHQDTPLLEPDLATPASTVSAPSQSSPVATPSPPPPPTPTVAPPVPPEKGPQDENLPVLLTEEEQDLPPPAYTAIDPRNPNLLFDAHGVSPQSNVHGGPISETGGNSLGKDSGGWGEDIQGDAVEWYGHELEGSRVPQRGAPQGPVIELPGDTPQAPAMELPGDDGLGLGGLRVSRASISGMNIYLCVKCGYIPAFILDWYSELAHWHLILLTSPPSRWPHQSNHLSPRHPRHQRPRTHPPRHHHRHLPQQPHPRFKKSRQTPHCPLHPLHLP